MFGSALLFCFLISGNAHAQDSLQRLAEQEMASHMENRMEDFSETPFEEDEERAAQMQQYAEKPLNLNAADEADLQSLGLLDAWQIKALLHYRESYGRLARLDELVENVKGFDAHTLERLRPFVCLEGEDSRLVPPAKAGRFGKHRFLARYARALKESKAYAENRYAGTPDQVYLQYAFNRKDRIHIGFAAKQNAGEAFNKQGFDFYSGHFSLQRFGAVKTWVIGTYKADFGYGLNMACSRVFYGGTSDLLVSNGTGIRPYASGAEYGFLQGSALQLSLPKAWSASLFYSDKRRDASLQSEAGSELSDFWDYVNAMPETGCHRTASEIKAKGAVREQIGGFVLEKTTAKARFGAVACGYVLGGLYTPEHKNSLGSNLLYSQLKAARGGNFSAYYRYLTKHFHFYGEAAFTETLQTAVLQALQYKCAEVFSLGTQYTWNSAGYYTPYASVGNSRPPRPAFSGTEKHVFSYHGKALLPAHFRLEFTGKETVERKNAQVPEHFHVFSGSLIYQPKRFTAYVKFRLDQSKSLQGHSLRFHASYQARNGFFGESRLEMRNFSKGVLLLQDAGYAAPQGGFRLRLRLALFQTEGYDHRIYAYEHDLLYAASVPALYGKGMRFFFLLSKSFGRFTAELKYAHTLMDGVQSIGSGDNEIKGFLKPELKVQLRWKVP